MPQKKWAIEFSPECEKEWDKLDFSIQKRVIDFFSERLKKDTDPKLLAKPLSGNLKHFWRYRIGDYRVVCNFNDKEKVISIVRIAHRKEIYD